MRSIGVCGVIFEVVDCYMWVILGCEGKWFEFFEYCYVCFFVEVGVFFI